MHPRDGEVSPVASQILVHTPGQERSSALSSAAASAVLQNLDILFTLFDGNHSPHGALTDSDLARCARVSRAFSDAALRVLWRDPPTLVPLWHVLDPPGLELPKEFAAAYHTQARNGQ